MCDEGTICGRGEAGIAGCVSAAVTTAFTSGAAISATAGAFLFGAAVAATAFVRRTGVAPGLGGQGDNDNDGKHRGHQDDRQEHHVGGEKPFALWLMMVMTQYVVSSP